MKPRLVQAVIGGLAGTIVMTLMMYFVAPMMMGGPMDIAATLGDVTGMGKTAGMVIHFVLGAVVFPAVLVQIWPMLPGGGWMKGLIFGMVLAVIALVVVMPMAGMGMFMANHPQPGMAVLGSLMGHALYGLILGWWSAKSVGVDPAPAV